MVVVIWPTILEPIRIRPNGARDGGWYGQRTRWYL